MEFDFIIKNKIYIIIILLIIAILCYFYNINKKDDSFINLGRTPPKPFVFSKPITSSTFSPISKSIQPIISLKAPPKTATQIVVDKIPKEIKTIMTINKPQPKAPLQRNIKIR
jgi:hypothetical protein